MVYRDDEDWDQPVGPAKESRVKESLVATILRLQMGAGWLGKQVRAAPGFAKELAVVLILAVQAAREHETKYPELPSTLP